MSNNINDIIIASTLIELNVCELNWSVKMRCGRPGCNLFCFPETTTPFPKPPRLDNSRTHVVSNNKCYSYHFKMKVWRQRPLAFVLYRREMLTAKSGLVNSFNGFRNLFVAV